MKKLLLIFAFLCALCVQSLSAQTIKGDMNDDGVLDVIDVNGCIATVLGNRAIQYVIGSADPYIVDNSQVVGTWNKNKVEHFTLNADGTTDYSSDFGEIATYEFLPYQGCIIFYDNAGNPISWIEVKKLEPGRMVCKMHDKGDLFVLTTEPSSQPMKIDNPDWTGVATEYEYSESGVTPVPYNWSSISTYCDISYTPASPKESGTYTCNITLKDNENYAWKSGNNGTTFTFTIKKQITEVPIYWGYCDSWNDEDEDRQLKNILSNGLIPVDNITTIENEFTISASDFLQRYSGSYLGAWWFAVPINKSVIGGLESDILSWDSTNIDRYTVKYNDIYSNESSEPLVITIEGIDYNVYARKTSGAPSSRNHTLKITIQ